MQWIELNTTSHSRLLVPIDSITAVEECITYNNKTETIVYIKDMHLYTRYRREPAYTLMIPENDIETVMCTDSLDTLKFFIFQKKEPQHGKQQED